MIKWYLVKSLRVAILVITKGIQQTPDGLSLKELPTGDSIASSMVSAFLQSGEKIIQKNGTSCCFDKSINELFGEISDFISDDAIETNLHSLFHVISENIQIVVFYQDAKELTGFTLEENFLTL